MSKSSCRVVVRSIVRKQLTASQAHTQRGAAAHCRAVPGYLALPRAIVRGTVLAYELKSYGAGGDGLAAHNDTSAHAHAPCRCQPASAAITVPFNPARQRSKQALGQRGRFGSGDLLTRMVSRKRRAQSPAVDAPLASEGDSDGGGAVDDDGAAVGDAATLAPPPAPAAAPTKRHAPAALAWMRDAHALDGESDVEFDAAGISLDARLIASLKAGGVDRLFPVQAAVWRTLHGGAHDLCVHAPTGSGKTLAYALPVVAALSGRVIRRLRALVVLPTHDLVQQARATQLAWVWFQTADLPRRLQPSSSRCAARSVWTSPQSPAKAR